MSWNELVCSSRRLTTLFAVAGVLASCGGGNDDTTSPSGARESRLAAPTAPWTVFQDSFTRADNQALGAPAIGGPWVEANEIYSSIGTPHRGTITPAWIELQSSRCCAFGIMKFYKILRV